MRKVNLFIILASTFISMVSFLACSKDDDDTKSEQDKEPIMVTSYDQVKFFQNNIVEIDSVGNVLQRLYGSKLNSADSTELYVSVDSLEEAIDLFKEWMSPDTKVEEVAPSEVNMKADLADESGVGKETVYFNQITDGGENVAEVTFKNGDVIKHISRIVFMKVSAWPENTEMTKYSLGEVVNYKGSTWVCIREAKPGRTGLIVCLYELMSEDEVARKISFRLAGESEAKTVSTVLKSDWDTYSAFFADAGMNLRSDVFYRTRETSWKFWTYHIKLSTGEGARLFDCTKYYLFVRSFGLVDE